MDKKELQAIVYRQIEKYFDEKEAKRLSNYLIEDLIAVQQELSQNMIEAAKVAAQRLIDGEPLQYVTQIAHFFGYQLFVNESVLIPRSETEELVYQVVKYLKKAQKSQPKLIDIGTGSGCIPITIKKEFEDCDLLAVDISIDALKVAIQNANSLGAEVSFMQMNILSDTLPIPDQIFDVIVSNPPYIPMSETSVMDDVTVRYEPYNALFTEDQYGLVFYQRIAHLCDFWLSDNGAVFLELNEFHADKIKEIFVRQGSFLSVEIFEDLQGKQRILRALRNQGS